jgi:hypothetical protein
MTTEESREVAEARASLLQHFDSHNCGYPESAVVEIDALEVAVRKDERERADVWAGELCWHRGPHSFSTRCNQRRDHLIHDGVCYGCDPDVPHTHHGFIPAQATDEYYAEKLAAPAEGGTEG